MGYESPVGYSVVYKTRRHWYEIVPETADALWWLTIIVLYAFSLAELFLEPRLLFSLSLVSYPLWHITAELIRWNHEWYRVLTDSHGKSRFVKTSGVLKRKSIEDRADDVSFIQETDLLGRYLHFTHVDLRSVRNIYTEGSLVPLKLIKALHSIQSKPPTLPENATNQQFIASQIVGWVRDGIVDPRLAQIATQKFILEQL